MGEVVYVTPINPATDPHLAPMARAHQEASMLTHFLRYRLPRDYWGDLTKLEIARIRFATTKCNIDKFVTMLSEDYKDAYKDGFKFRIPRYQQQLEECAEQINTLLNRLSIACKKHGVPLNVKWTPIDDNRVGVPLRSRPTVDIRLE